MPNRNPDLNRNSYREVVKTISGVIQTHSGEDVGDFSPDNLGFSQTNTVEGDGALTYAKYVSLSSLALDTLIKNFPERVRAEDEHTWVADIDVHTLINGVLGYLRTSGFLVSDPGVELHG